MGELVVGAAGDAAADVVRVAVGIAAAAVGMVDGGGGKVMLAMRGQVGGRGVHRVGRRGSTSPAGRAAVMVQRHAMGRWVLFWKVGGRRVPPAAASGMSRIAVGGVRRRRSTVRMVVVVIVV